VFVLWAVWRCLPAPDGPPILSMALSFQWLQVTLGVFYYSLTGRTLNAMLVRDYRPMVLIGLGCIVAILIGLRLGIAMLPATRRDDTAATRLPLSLKGLVVVYAISLAVEGTVTQVAWSMPNLTQAILAFNFMHLGLLFLLFRRLSRPIFQWHLMAALLVFEVLLGLTGFFAGFREPFIMASIVLLELFDARRIHHWVAVGVLGGAAVAMALMWISVRGEYRADYYTDLVGKSREARLGRIAELSQGFTGQDRSQVLANADKFVDRMWVVH
jgi:hypothetical protein